MGEPIQAPTLTNLARLSVAAERGHGRRFG